MSQRTAVCLPARRSTTPRSDCTELDILEAYLEAGIVDMVSVPCSITDTLHALAADAHRAGRMNLVMTSHEGNLAGLAAGIQFGTGRIALVHMQNSGLPNAGDGFISLADPEVYRVSMAAMVTYRGATTRDDSEPHQAIGRRTDALCEAIFGPAAGVFGSRCGSDLLAEVRRSIASAHRGGIGVVKVAEAGFRKAARAELVEAMTPTGCPRRALRAGKGVDSIDPAMRSPTALSRDEAIRAIADRHPSAALLFCNGYTSRAARATVDHARCFYNIGYMGGTLAIGWALAKSRPDLEVVVVDGDQNALMSTMKDQLAADYPSNLHWYILDNGIGASVGTSVSVPLSAMHGDLARIVETRPDEPGTFPHARVRAERAGAPIATLAVRFRNWIAAQAGGAES